MTCRRQCGYLSQGVLLMRNQTMCDTGLGCLLPWSFYHILYVLGIAILASIFTCPTWCSWSLWCIGMIYWVQYCSFLFFLPKAVFQLYSVGCLHLYFLAFWNSHPCSVDPSFPLVTPSRLSTLWTNQLIIQCNISWIKIIFHWLRTQCSFAGTCVSPPLILWVCQNVWLSVQSLFIYFFINMWHLVVVELSYYCALLVLTCAIFNAPIISIDQEPLWI